LDLDFRDRERERERDRQTEMVVRRSYKEASSVPNAVGAAKDKINI
jgi:hypothetical protein